MEWERSGELDFVSSVTLPFIGARHQAEHFPEILRGHHITRSKAVWFVCLIRLVLPL